MKISNSPQYMRKMIPNSTHLKIINDIRFTARELDVIACLLSGRGTKTIAQLLSIEEKTVETHKYNIMRKLECNSKEGIIQFIERSGKLEALKKHYLSLLSQSIFEIHLNQVSSLIKNKNYVCTLIYEQANEGSLFTNQLINHLKLMGFRTNKETIESHKYQEKLSNQLKIEENHSIIYLVSELLIEKFKADDHKSKQNLVELTQNLNRSKNKLVVLLEGKEPLVEIPKLIHGLSYIDLGLYKEYQFCFFDILQVILSNPGIEKISLNFKEQYKAVFNSSNQTGTDNWSSMVGSYEIVSLLPNFVSYLIANKKIGLKASIFLMVTAACLWLFLSIKNNDDKLAFQDKTRSYHAIRSDLPIPADNVILNRPELIKEIDEKLNEDSGIEIVALVGIGGAGKTTIARQYAFKQRSPIVWEINAETRAGLMESFEKIAYDLAKSDEEKRQLKSIQEIKDSNIREEKVIQFVKQKLKLRQRWILIYDNVEQFTDVQKYFPQDSNTWGKGKVIVTTRDSTIHNNNYIKNTIIVGELGIQEKERLFMNIMEKGKHLQITRLPKKEIMMFLNELPPYPLDISLAAFYLKATNIPYERYLENIRESKENFEDTQEKILKEATKYTKTRYSIIRLSIKQLIDTNKDFEDLLLFISIIDSQDIPRSLLDSYKDSAIVDSFIYYLKKYSLISNGSSSTSDNYPYLSIHRSTQDICLSFLTKTLDVKKKSISITKTLERYITNVANKVDYSLIKILPRHCETILTHGEILSINCVAAIEGKLGSIYYYLADYQKSKKILEKSLQKLNENDIMDRAQIAQNLVYLGMDYKKLGNDEKAKVLIKKGLIIYEKDFPDNHLEVAWALGNLGIVYRQLGDYEKAITLFGKSLEIYRKYFDKNYIGNAWALSNLGNTFRNLGYYKKAQDLLEQSFLVFKQNLPENHSEIAWVLVHIGDTYRNLGKYEKSENLLKQSLRILEKQFGKDHLDVAWVLADLGKVYRDIGYHEATMNLLKQARNQEKPSHIKNSDGSAWYSILLRRSEKDTDHYYGKTKKLLEESLVRFEKHFGKNHIYTARIMEFLGEYHMDLGHYEKAVDLIKRSLKIYEDNFGNEHVKTARVLRSLGEIYLLHGCLEYAENHINRALIIFRKNNYSEYYKVIENLADLSFKKSMNEKNANQVQNYIKRPIEYLREALAIARNHFPPDSSHIIRIQAKLSNLEKNIVKIS